MNKHYFKYLMRSHKNINLFLLITNLIITTFNFLISTPNVSRDENILMLSSSLVLIECLIMPIIVFFYRFSKRASDTYFSLPLKRSELFITSIVYIATVIISIHLLALVPVFIDIAIHFSSIFELLMAYGKYLLFLVIAVFATILITLAIILNANTIFDAIVILGAYIALPFLVSITVDIFSSNIIVGYSVPSFDIMTYLFLPSIFINSFPTVFGFNYLSHTVLMNYTSSTYIYMMILLVGGIVSGLVAYRNFKFHHAEKAEQLSDNFFAYPFLIIFVAVCLIAITISSTTNIQKSLFANLGETLMWILIVFVAYQIMCFIYRRHVRISKKSLIIFAIAILINYGFVIAAQKTRGFGLSEGFKKESTIKELHLNISFGKDDVDNYENYAINIASKGNKLNAEQDHLAKEIQQLLTDRAYEPQSNPENDKFNNVWFNLNVEYPNDHYYSYHSWEYEKTSSLSEDDFKAILGLASTLSESNNFESNCERYLNDAYVETSAESIIQEFERIYSTK